MNQPVAIKVTAKPHFENVSSHFLMIERTIYRDLINPIVLCGFSPHVLIYYGAVNCDSFFSIPELDAEMIKFKQDLRKKYSTFDTNYIMASVVERAIKGQSVSDFLLNASLSGNLSTDIFAILFQIFYTLKVFSQLGLSHNDLHGGNVFLVPATSHVRYYQTSDTDFYRVESEWEARIFDFDRGSKVATSFDSNEVENHGLTVGRYCEMYGQCNGVNERAEIYPLLATFNSFLQRSSPEINSMIDEIAPRELLERNYKGQMIESSDYPVAYPVIPGHTLAFNGRLCTCNSQECSTCTVLNDPRIKTLDEIFKIDAFASLKVDKNSIPHEEFIWRLPSVASEAAERNWQELHA